jgi:hypothetical protein
MTDPKFPCDQLRPTRGWLFPWRAGTDAGRKFAPLRYHHRTWVTREHVGADRIASAWLIRRHIDPVAHFKFVPATGYVPHPDELRFDMAGAEYAHEGRSCTFEVLLRRLGPQDAVLSAIAEIVHDIDLQEATFGRAEAAGVSRVIGGICAATADDTTRIERGCSLLENLYAGFARAAGGTILSVAR